MRKNIKLQSYSIYFFNYYQVFFLLNNELNLKIFKPNLL